MSWGLFHDLLCVHISLPSFSSRHLCCLVSRVSHLTTEVNCEAEQQKANNNSDHFLTWSLFFYSIEAINMIFSFFVRKLKLNNHTVFRNQSAHGRGSLFDMYEAQKALKYKHFLTKVLTCWPLDLIGWGLSKWVSECDIYMALWGPENIFNRHVPQVLTTLLLHFKVMEQVRKQGHEVRLRGRRKVWDEMA